MRTLLFFLFLISIQSIGQSQVTTDSLHSNILGNNRVYQIYHPNVDQPTPLIIVIDGHNYFDLIKTTVEYLSLKEQMPYATIVGINSTGAERYRYYTSIPYAPFGSSEKVGGEAEKFLKFIDGELIPHLEESFQLANNRTLIGHSLGGLFAFYAMLEKPDSFTNYVAISPSFFWGDEYLIEELDSKIDSINLENKHLVYSFENPLNTDEYRNHRFETLPNDLYIKKVERILNKKNNKLKRQFYYYPDCNHVSVVPVAISEAIVNLFSFFQLDNEAMAKTLDETPQTLIKFIDKHYNQLSEKLGYKILPEEKFLRGYAGFIESMMPDKQEFSRALKEKADSLYPPDKN